MLDLGCASRVMVDPCFIFPGSSFCVTRGLPNEGYESQNCRDIMVYAADAKTVTKPSVKVRPLHTIGRSLEDREDTRGYSMKFCLGVYQNIKDYCISCPECQLVGPRPTHRTQLVPNPSVSNLFVWVGVVLFELLEPSASCCCFIPILLNYGN